jgi:hypothetical protein
MLVLISCMFSPIHSVDGYRSHIPHLLGIMAQSLVFNVAPIYVALPTSMISGRKIGALWREIVWVWRWRRMNERVGKVAGLWGRESNAELMVNRGG